MSLRRVPRGTKASSFTVALCASKVPPHFFIILLFYNVPHFNRLRQERWDRGGFSFVRKGATAICVAQLLTVGFGLLDFFPSASEPFVAYAPSCGNPFIVKPNKTKVDKLRTAIEDAPLR